MTIIATYPLVNVYNRLHNYGLDHHVSWDHLLFRLGHVQQLYLEKQSPKGPSLDSAGPIPKHGVESTACNEFLLPNKWLKNGTAERLLTWDFTHPTSSSQFLC